MPEDHPLADCSFVKLDDFGGQNLISHTDKGRNRFYQEVLKAKGIEPKNVMNIGVPQAIIEMVAAGFGLTTFPRWALTEALKTWKIAARPITPSGFPLTWHAVYLTHSNIPMYQQEFVRSISHLNVTEQTIARDYPAMA
jgi:LysR family transcriptional regulator for metE and metH